MKEWASQVAAAAASAAKSLQSCPTLCDPIDGSPPGSPTPGILQARILEWVAVSFSIPGGTTGKEPACQCRRCKRCRFDPWVGKIPWRRAWQPTPVFLPGEPQGQRSLVGYGPQGHRVGHDRSSLTCMHANERMQGGLHMTFNIQQWSLLTLRHLLSVENNAMML